MILPGDNAKRKIIRNSTASKIIEKLLLLQSFIDNVD